MALYTPEAIPIHKATIVPRGDSLGMVCIVHKRVLCILCKKKERNLSKSFLKSVRQRRNLSPHLLLGLVHYSCFEKGCP